MSECQTCSSGITCDSCKDGYYYNIMQCPDCSSSCKTCTSSSSHCTSCYD